MPKSRNRKNHKQKVNARRVEMKQQKAKNEKAHREFIMNLIKQEQERGAFNTNGPVSIKSSSFLLLFN